MMLVNERGDAVRLGAQLAGGEGGEGAVYEVASAPSLVAKIYKTPNSQKTAKLKSLRLVQSTQLQAIASLPKEILFSGNDRRTARGFLMPRVLGKEIHRLYGPRDRQLEFPSAAWDFLIHVARNCAVAFETLHENGILMADVNEKNLLVTDNGLVRLIDCDSYQVRSGNGHLLCDVGVPLWTPPELQGHDFRGLVRTPNHDRFGLAVLIFELLFMGRHPFAGVPDSQHHYEIHEAIQRFLFAFSKQTWQRGLKAPPHTLSLSALPAKIGLLFERTFLSGSERPNARPSGREWAHELDALHSSLKTCNYDPGHKYWNGLVSCPWCQIAASGGPNFFISVAIHLGAAGTVADVSAFWTTIQRIVMGDLVRKSVGPIHLPVVTARPMPLARPTAPRLSKPQPPSPLVLPPLPTLPSPVYPPRPELSSPSLIRRLPRGRYERDELASAFGILICALLCAVSIGLGLLAGAFFAGSGSIVFLLVWAMKSDTAIEEHRLRLEVEQQAREEEQKRNQKEFSTRLTEHDADVNLKREQHTRAVAFAELEHARECSNLEVEHRMKSSAYCAQLNLFEKLWARFESEKRQWEIESNSRAESVEQTRREMTDASERLRAALADYQVKVRAFSVNLEAVHQRFQKASADELTGIKALDAKKRETQLHQYLDSRLIMRETYIGIGDTRKATLVGYGIESALDIRSDLKVPGFGPVLIDRLIDWRRSCEAAFRYNPNTPLPQAEVQAVKLKFAQARQSALVELRGGAGSMSALETETQRTINSLEAKILLLARTHAQAIADHHECS